jgi:hypothetical protein
MAGIGGSKQDCAEMLAALSRAKKGEGMGINSWSAIEQRKRNETDAKAGDDVPRGKKGDATSRLRASEGPAEDSEKGEVVEKLEKLEEHQQEL